MANQFSTIEEGAAKGREFLDEIAAAMQAKVPDFAVPEPITALEWSNARPTPDCIVQDLFYADVAVLIAPGGMGKTTLELKEAVHIVLGLPLYGLTVHKPGGVLFITAEDSREMLVARLRAICHAMQLTDVDIAIVMQRIRIADVSGNQCACIVHPVEFLQCGFE
ncbi:MAG: hypothetical protein EPN14_02525 [Gallionella sp.]|nr:MAG: hypothetical protein EPN14_02525 [Gallionella sp.]